MKTIHCLMAMVLAVVLMASVGCSSSDPLDKAAAPVSDTSKAPDPVQRERPHRAPPLAGPNAGKDMSQFDR